MENKEKYVYYDNEENHWIEIPSEHINDAKLLREHYLYNEDGWDGNEVKIYKLELAKTLKKEITYKFKE